MRQVFRNMLHRMFYRKNVAAGVSVTLPIAFEGTVKPAQIYYLPLIVSFL